MAKPDLKQVFGSASSKVGNYRSRNIIMSITIALLLIGAFLLFAVHTNRLTKLIQSEIEVQILLENDLDQADSLRIAEWLTSQPFVLKKDGKPQIRYVSKDEAANYLSRQLRQNILAYAKENPLRNYYIINILPEYYREDKLAQIKDELSRVAGIYEVSYAFAAVEKINRNIRIIGIVVFSLAALLIVLTVFLVHTAVRLALYSQRFIIRSMQLVGATEGFIKKPFVIRSGLYGMLSGIIASALLTAGLLWLYEIMPDFKRVSDWFVTALIFLSLLVAGALIAAASTSIAVSKYLNRSLDDLYKS